MLLEDPMDFGPKCFKLINHWMEEDGFNKVIEASWASGDYSSSKNISKKKDIQSRLDEWDAKAEARILTSLDCLKREEDLMLDQLDRCFLDSSFTLDEVKEHCLGPELLRPLQRTLGSDGLNFKFIKRYWDIINIEFFNFIKYFEKYGCLAKGYNASFIVLIRKTLDQLDLQDYRPISLIGCMQMLDGSLIANEIINVTSKEKLRLLLFKVDFEKAFDSVNWNFLMNTMAQMGFGVKWRKWIYACLSSALVSILINGSPSKEFPMKRSLPVGRSMRKIADWTEVINRIFKRLASWKENLLSIGGRLTLVKSVFRSLSVYFLSLFKAPEAIITKLESMRR
ncbi:RNA-directed DNA polymerase, eukaryota, reverse transcriptase zinc-binding domain protein [Tanacetum coccineum]